MSLCLLAHRVARTWGAKIGCELHNSQRAVARKEITPWSTCCDCKRGECHQFLTAMLSHQCVFNWSKGAGHWHCHLAYAAWSKGNETKQKSFSHHIFYRLFTVIEAKSFLLLFSERKKPKSHIFVFI